METHDELNSRVDRLEERVGATEKDVKELRTGLLGTLGAPGALELMRRTSETTIELKGCIETLSTNVDSLKSDRTKLTGIITGVAFIGGLLGFLIHLVIK